jgi:TM2 domain-containing membrane protein YozV
MSGFDTQENILIEQIVANEVPSTAVAYLLVIFLGFFGAHRFYLGRPGSAVLQFISCILIFGIAWVLIDLVLIPGMIRAKKDQIRQREMLKLLAARRPVDRSAAPAVPQGLVDRLLAEEAQA